jgi:PAS domain S-box-containing protein
VTYWYTQIFYIFMILSLQWLANHTIQRALRVARRELEQRKQTERTLRESEERYRIVVEHIGQVIYEYDIASGKIQWQGAIRKLAGFASPEAVGSLDVQQWRKLIDPSDRPKAVEAWETAIKTSSPYQAQYRFRQQDGSCKFIEDHGILIPGETEKPLRLIGTMTDITARKLVEDQNAELTRGLERRVGERTAELKSANRELEAFSYSVSHDLRGPLRTIAGYSTILLTDYQSQLPAEAGFLLDQIGASARRMGQLISDLLALSQVGRQPLVPSDINVQSMVDGIIAELSQQEPQREVKWEVSTLLPCRGEPSLIQQVFVNLVGNAFKFTRDRKPAVIEITSQAQNGQVQYAVRDNGAGFDMQFAKKLFAPFERLHKAAEFEGSGIGLSIVQRILQRHGGNISAESVPDRGATFSFTLPVAGFAKA